MPDVMTVHRRIGKQRQAKKAPYVPGGSADSSTAPQPDGTAGDAAVPPPALDPNLPTAQQDRRTKWREAPEELKEEFIRVHKAFNHPPNVTLARLIARAG